MKTKMVNYDSLVTTYNGKVFKHGEVVYTPNIYHNESTNIEVNFKIATLNDSVGDFTDELSALIAKYAK
jgi:hypothetical protein